MGLLDFLRPAAAQAAPAARAEPPVSASAETNVSSESQWNGFVVAGGQSKSGVRVNEKSALTIPATLQALRILTGVFAMTPLHFYQKSDRGRLSAEGNPAAVLFRLGPNSHQTAFAFFELLLADILLAGNFYGYISRDQRGEVKAVTRLKPGHCQPVEYFDRAEGTILFFDATLPDGSHERFPARDIFHVGGFSRDGIQGLNPVQYARDALGGAIATSDHASRFWNKGGRPSTVLTSANKIGPEDKGRIRKDWTQMYSGPDADMVAVLDQDLKAEFLTHDLKSNQFIETRQFQVVDLARIWGVPPHLIFDLSRATFGNIEQQSLEFVIYHLGPHYTRVAQAATKAFARAGFYFEHVTDALVKGDLKSRMEAYWLQRQMGMANGNELRSYENLPNIKGAAGTDYWMPANMQVAGKEHAQDSAGQSGDQT
ncbi:Phage portal protein [Tritonibacter mobilis]|jgi:HK97 family phage portal protein|uniref:phage portal protein n=1 Tax=Tritonibacter mobilis TaxID=379347 RepID=UPI000F6F2D54|nr:phage portal protein [Tritonibacter mobilis]VCU58265.1 Phage portal protein [Tritonibacter mobilis]